METLFAALHGPLTRQLKTEMSMSQVCRANVSIVGHYSFVKDVLLG